ncbi:hypothetical protein [Isoptericola aurantiacus]|uniref:hypothetical protein n=1 Tax=Isoptericola aurantiacus TaxID=3377839 RepID=UPI00383A83E0
MTDDGTRPGADEVFTFPPRPGWIFWPAGLNPAGWGDIAAEVPGGENDDAVIAAVRAVDERAAGAGDAWGAGIWFDPANDHRPTASLLVRTFRARGDVTKAFRRAVKGARRVPRIPGVVVDGYTSDSVETGSGPLLVQVVDTSDATTGQVLHTWRLSLFPLSRDEVVEIECDTPYSHLVDHVEDEISELVNGSTYARLEVS